MPSHPTPGLAPRPATSRTSLPSQPGLVGVRLSATQAAELDWHRLDETWAAAGEEHVVSACWLSDHLSDANLDRNGPAFESLTLAGALAHRVVGKWIGIAVASATFRHPAVLAKAATVLDNVTGGRFILGVGAGWHVGEHHAFGIPLLPPRERFDRLESQLRVLHALFSEQASHRPGVSLDDPFYPLREATNEPSPVRSGGPLVWIGAGKPRGIALLARYASGWPMPGNRPGDVSFFIESRDRILRGLEAAGRDPASFSFAAQLSCGTTPADRRASLATARRFVAAGATHVILGLPASIAPDGMIALADEVAEPLAERAAGGGTGR
jgi:alkanesulfonate monooxygenase SsuD/methylene tetrahydromethanopterin reductase-like flavin-dependent oxidoreductase (luciferase family)